MTHNGDIRYKVSIRHEDVLALNFFRIPSKFFFRKHFNQGLRSHVIEVLNPESVRIERQGEIRDGVRHYPRAVPRHVLRIFKNRFHSLGQALDEIERIKVLERFLPRNSYAKSNEFIVSFSAENTTDIGLCGLQEYVDGDILDPWSLSHIVRPKNIRPFVTGLREMATTMHMIPDLAGIGNLKIDSIGQVRLVDINNISMVRFSETIPLDDNGYPACDKSVEVLYRLEKHFVNPALPIEKDPIYRFFLTRRRMEAVSAREKAFYSEIARKR